MKQTSPATTIAFPLSNDATVSRESRLLALSQPVQYRPLAKGQVVIILLKDGAQRFLAKGPAQVAAGWHAQVPALGLVETQAKRLEQV